MVTKLGRIPVTFALAAGLMLSAPACAPHGHGLEGVTVPRGRSTVVTGEVRSIDHRRNHMTIREGYGRSYTLSYDNKTRVIDGNRRYSINALDRGEQVRVWVAYDRRGTPWIERVEVRDNVRGRRDDSRDRRVATPRVQRLDGTISWLDSRRNSFTLEHGRNNRVVVRIPSRLQRDDARRIERLRRGDRVSIDVREIDRGTVELIRFR